MAGAEQEYRHLPPGCPPGEQTKRWGALADPVFGFKRYGRWRPLIGGVIVGLPAAVVVQLIAGGISGQITFFGLGLAGAAATWAWDRRPRVEAGRIELSLPVEACRRGDTVTVTARPSRIATGEIRARCSLVCTAAYTEIIYGTGVEGGSEVIRDEVELARVDSEPGPIAHGRTVALALPADTAYSYEGMTVTHAWRVEAREVDGRRFGWQPIWILP